MGATGRLGFATGLALAAALWCPPNAGAAGAGTSLRFTGTEGGSVDRVKFPVDVGGQSTPLNVGGWDFTIEFWMRARAADNTAPAPDCGAFRHWSNGNVVVDRDRYGQSQDWGIAVAGGKILAGIATETMSKSVCGGTSILDDGWHHVVFQYDYESTDPGALNLYVDGVQDGSTGGVQGHADYPGGGEIGDGCGGPCVNDPFMVVGGGKVNGVGSFRGFIDEMRVSNVVRYTESFIRPIVPFVRDESTMGLFHFDEAAGTAIRDASAWPTSGTRTVSSGGGPEWWTATPFAAGPGARVGASGSA
ncbi:MAG: LamG-like jellyroll fold domain-containing protein, partial [Actinomycetota bacterium]